jgi:osmotically-inducible protein OsmY
MKAAFAFRVVLAPTVLSLGLVLPAFAQSNSGASAGAQMHAAGESLEQAGTDTTTAAKNVFHGTVTAVRDTEITARVKASLLRDSATEHSNIHVSTSAGIVTLHGEVASAEVAMRAARLAQNAKGVKEVKNDLAISTLTVAN